jgi:DNA-binding transcriptional LysR family regulator
LALVVAPPNALWRKQRVSLVELLAQPLVQREPGSGSRRCLERALERAGVSASELNVVLELGSNEAVKEAVLQGVGVAVLSARVVEREIKSGQLKALPVEGLALDRTLFVVRDRRHVLSAPGRLFLDVVTRQTATPCPA